MKHSLKLRKNTSEKEQKTNKFRTHVANKTIKEHVHQRRVKNTNTKEEKVTSRTKVTNNNTRCVHRISIMLTLAPVGPHTWANIGTNCTRLYPCAATAKYCDVTKIQNCKNTSC